VGRTEALASGWLAIAGDLAGTRRRHPNQYESSGGGRDEDQTLETHGCSFGESRFANAERVVERR
jgi:hypothetical protein